MTDKREAVSRLRERGYDVYDEDGVVMFYETSYKDAERACRTIGYIASFGSRPKRNRNGQE